MAYKNKRTREREAAKQRAFAERVESVITDPMYEKIQDILKGTDAKTFDEARTVINRHSRKISKENPSDILRFLKENEDIVFNPDIDFDAIKKGKQAKAGTSSTAKAETSSTANSETTSTTNSETTSTTKNKNTGESNSSKKRKQRAQAAQEATEEAAEKAAREAVEEGIDELGPSNLKKIFNKRVFNIGLNAAFAISDYKDARDSGKGVVGSAVKAGALFAAGEVLQGAMLPVMLAGSMPKMAVGAIETTQRMTRQMNNMQRIQTFGESYFQDTQQLATMRQAGMELAKMSQYNLQQSIMGNEAQYMHNL